MDKPQPSFREVKHCNSVSLSMLTGFIPQPAKLSNRISVILLQKLDIVSYFCTGKLIWTYFNDVGFLYCVVNARWKSVTRNNAEKTKAELKNGRSPNWTWPKRTSMNDYICKRSKAALINLIFVFSKKAITTAHQNIISVLHIDIFDFLWVWHFYMNF